LYRHGIAIISFESVQEGLNAVADKKNDAFVLNEHMLKNNVKKDFHGRVQVLPAIFDEYFVVIAIKNEHELRKKINKALLKIMKTEKWDEILNRYIRENRWDGA
jgi:polar amino acid transport system substrate-binding protein